MQTQPVKMLTSSATTLRPIRLNSDAPVTPPNPATAPPATATPPQTPPANGGNNPQPPAEQSGNTPPANGGNNPQTPPTPPVDTPPAEPTITLTQAELSAQIQSGITAALKDKTARDAAKAKRDAQAATRQAAIASGDADAIAAADRSESEQLQADLNEQTRVAAQAQRDLLVFRAASQYALDADLTEILVNDGRVVDQATADAAAKKLAAYKKPPVAPPTDAGSGNRPQARQTANSGGGRGAGPQSNGGNNEPNGTPNYPFTRPNDVPWPTG